jgi:DNA-binding GntR family transcriptional regulator
LAVFTPDSTSPSRVDAAYRQLRRAIIDGDYPPGAPLRHAELADAFGVSLIPIREAIRRLEVERLVDSVPNKGARVAPISLEDVRDVYATRVLLEVEALRRAWPRLDEEAVAEIRELREAMVERVRRDDPRFYELHRQIHFGLYERSGSPWLVHLIEIVWSHTERYRRLAASLGTFVAEPADLHGVVLDAIAAGDIDQAAAALRQDLERTVNLIIETYQESG